jgi:hypothetical protein
MSNLKSESKNPIFICLIMLLIGAGLGVWGWIKSDCIGTNCWEGSGFLMWIGGILIVVAIAGWAIFGGGKEKR